MTETPPYSPIGSPWAAIVLAAGASQRLGQPKQLLACGGQPLLVRTLETVLRAGAAPVVTVLGAHADKIHPVIAGLPVIVAMNPDWSSGMASSIRAGLRKLETAPAWPTCQAVLLSVCDQPLLSVSALERLRQGLTDRHSIVATRYGETLGVPALFAREHVAALHQTEGHAGARELIAAQRKVTLGVALPELAWDVDTPEDWERRPPELRE